MRGDFIHDNEHNRPIPLCGCGETKRIIIGGSGRHADCFEIRGHLCSSSEGVRVHHRPRVLPTIGLGHGGQDNSGAGLQADRAHCPPLR